MYSMAADLEIKRGTCVRNFEECGHFFANEYGSKAYRKDAKTVEYTGCCDGWTCLGLRPVNVVETWWKGVCYPIK